MIFNRAEARTSLRNKSKVPAEPVDNIQYGVRQPQTQVVDISALTYVVHVYSHALAVFGHLGALIARHVLIQVDMVRGHGSQSAHALSSSNH
jgi:hypothetical protein